VTGPSGAGKSTLLHVIGGLDRVSSGTATVDGTNLEGLAERDLAAFRRDTIGFVFQFFNLLPALLAWENVAIPRLLSGERLATSKVEANRG
jgi:putative ABC transport system ATP-binding protein